MSTGPLVDRHEHVRRISAAWQNTVRNIVETGRFLIEAKEDIGRGGFEEMIRAELPFGPRTAQRLMEIAEDRVLSNTTHASHLPASWMTLYELAKLPKHGLDLEVLIEEGAIHPKMERKDARALLPAPEQRDDDLPPNYEGSGVPAGPPPDQRTPEDEQEFEATITPPVILGGKRKLEIENLALKSEIEELRAERDQLRARVAELESVLATSGAVQGEKPKRGRGRPKGSKNKSKAQPIDGEAATPPGGNADGLNIPGFLRRDAVAS
jgi:Protein of unknown function (DUF3102)